MSGVEPAARTVFDASVVQEWMTGVQLRWLPRHPVDRPGHSIDPDAERLIALVPRWRALLMASVDEPHAPQAWALDPNDPRSVQVVDAYLAGFAFSLAAALSIPPDPDIDDSQPIVVATALAGAAALVEQMDQFDGSASPASDADRAGWSAELTVAAVSGNTAVDIGSSGGSLAAATRGAAQVAADLALGRNGPGYQIATLVGVLADVVQPPVEPDESRSRYDVRLELTARGLSAEVFADVVRRELRLNTEPGAVLELDVGAYPGLPDTFLVHVLTRKAGPVVEALLDLGRPSGLQIEVR